MTVRDEQAIDQAFWLVQRLQAGYGNKTGFDGQFRLEYMGSSEFEFGAVPASLRTIRANLPLETIERSVTVNAVTRTVYVVGPAAWVAAEADRIQQWIDVGCPGKENARFTGQIDGSAGDYDRKTIAWWSLGNSIAWTFEADYAERLALGFTPTGA